MKISKRPKLSIRKVALLKDDGFVSCPCHHQSPSVGEIGEISGPPVEFGYFWVSFSKVCPVRGWWLTTDYFEDVK